MDATSSRGGGRRPAPPPLAQGTRMESKARPARPIQPGRLAAHRAEVVRVAVSALAATLLSGTAHAAALAGQEPPPPPPARVDVVGVVGDLATGGPVVGA
ncbi:MAG: hypothetical protein O2958_09170, partial [Gemmatimonadetes bacterium]|nr:hypothetical protein [Gemmatimonadota bacterium]